MVQGCYVNALCNSIILRDMGKEINGEEVYMVHFEIGIA